MDKGIAGMATFFNAHMGCDVARTSRQRRGKNRSKKRIFIMAILAVIFAETGYILAVSKINLAPLPSPTSPPTTINVTGADLLGLTVTYGKVGDEWRVLGPPTPTGNYVVVVANEAACPPQAGGCFRALEELYNASGGYRKYFLYWTSTMDLTALRGARDLGILLSDLNVTMLLPREGSFEDLSTSIGLLLASRGVDVRNAVLPVVMVFRGGNAVYAGYGLASLREAKKIVGPA